MTNILNGNDLYSTYGLTITNVVPALLALPDRKASVSHDFPEENGISIDLTNPAFSARTFTFNCILQADTVGDLKNRYQGLFTLLKIAGTYQFYNSFLDMTVYLFYQKQSNLTSVNRTASGFAIKFDLQFGETDPDANLPDVYLVDDQNRFIVP